MIIANLEQLEVVSGDQVILGGWRVSNFIATSNTRSIAASSAYASGTNTSSFTSVQVSTVSNTVVRKIGNRFKDVPKPSQENFPF
jgi:hypothetical protein